MLRQFEIAKLALAPGDVLVVRMTPPPSPTVVDRVAQVAKAAAPDNKVLIIGNDVELSVLHKSDIEARVR